MLSLTLDDLKGDLGFFDVCVLASARARQISQGSKPKVSARVKKVTTLALAEVIQNKVEYSIDELSEPVASEPQAEF